MNWERGYKWAAHRRCRATLDRPIFEALLRAGDFREIATRAVKIESATNLLFSFEKMALRDGVRSGAGARVFAEGLFAAVHGTGSREERFERWAAALGQLPRRQTRVLTWPLQTVFLFLAEPKREIFLKPMVTRRGAASYGFEFDYISKPNWRTYRSLLDFTRLLKKDLADLVPRDMIDLQSFIWVQGSEEYS